MSFKFMIGWTFIWVSVGVALYIGGHDWKVERNMSNGLFFLFAGLGYLFALLDYVLFPEK